MTVPVADPISFHMADIDHNVENPEKIIQWLTSIATEKGRALSSIEYVLCSDEYLLEINQKYLYHDTLTDIITFPIQESPLEATIYISVERVKENSQLYDSTIIDETHRVMVHGLLHLLGYKDKTDEQKKEMRFQEDQALEKRTFA